MLSLALAVSMLRDIVLVTGFVNQSFPQPLDKEDEQHYFELWRNHGDKQAHDILVEHNLRLVAHVAKVFATSSPFACRETRHDGQADVGARGVEGDVIDQLLDKSPLQLQWHVR